MKVTLIDFTGNGTLDPARYAANILIFTKSTRLNMTPKLMVGISQLEQDTIMKELKLLANTNPGSWEFIHLSFLIEDVTRAFTHQLVRTRTASYAQQSLRVVKMEKWKYDKGASISASPDNQAVYESTMRYIDQAYNKLLDLNVSIEDARGILPTNILTNICMTINMRNFINLVRKRQSFRVQNEFRKVADLMIIEVEKVYPWFYLFYKNDEMQAFKDLSEMIEDHHKLTHEEKIEIYKKLDIIKGEI